NKMFNAHQYSTLIKNAGLSYTHSPQSFAHLYRLPLKNRVEKILLLLKQPKYTAMYISFFILYDISQNKVRNLVAKYLIRNGCVRVQKSVFYGYLKRKQYEEIKTAIIEINQMYENHDSIFV